MAESDREQNMKRTVQELPPFGSFDVAERDRQAIESLNSTFSGLIFRLFGIQAVSWRQEIDLVVEVAYVAATTLLGAQTLGEEKVGVIQTDNFKKLPSLMKSVVANLAPASLIYVVLALLKRVEAGLVSQSGNYGDKEEQAERTKRSLRRISCIRAAFELLHRLHFASLLLATQQTEISKRLWGIRYMLIRPLQGQQETNHQNSPQLAIRVFRILGVATLLDVLVRSCFLFRYSLHLANDSKLRGSLSDEKRGLQIQVEKSMSTEGSNASRCVICLESWTDATATPCGHVGCWSCVTAWVQRHRRCPLCQTSIDNPNRLVFLQNLQ